MRLLQSAYSTKRGCTLGNLISGLPAAKCECLEWARPRRHIQIASVCAVRFVPLIRFKGYGVMSPKADTFARDSERAYLGEMDDEPAKKSFLERWAEGEAWGQVGGIALLGLCYFLAWVISWIKF